MPFRAGQETSSVLADHRSGQEKVAMSAEWKLSRCNVAPVVHDCVRPSITHLLSLGAMDFVLSR